MGAFPRTALQIDLQRTGQCRNRLGRAVNDKQIALSDLFPARPARHALVAAHQPHDGAIMLFGLGVQIAHPLTLGF